MTYTNLFSGLLLNLILDCSGSRDSIGSSLDIAAGLIYLLLKEDLLF